jgi:hypothetical protein
MILDLLNFKLKELNGEHEYKVMKLTIDEEEEQGTAIIKDTNDNTISNWYYDKDLAWIKY